MNKRGRFAVAVLCGLALTLGAGLAGVWVVSASRVPDGRPHAGIGANRPPSEIFIDPDPLEDGGLVTAGQFMALLHDPTSLAELREVIQARSRVGLAVLGAEVDELRIGLRTPKEEVAQAGRLFHQIGLLNLYEGRFSKAASSFRKALKVGRTGDLSARVRAERLALLGIIALHGTDLGQNAAAPDGILPITRDPRGAGQAGTREAVENFTASLELCPGDFRVRWLLNVAYLRLGEYPAQVPPKYLIPFGSFRSMLETGRFENVAAKAGLTLRGPSLCGGSVFDDLNNDGFPDLLSTSVDPALGTALFINRGDGTFEDRTGMAGLDGQIYALNAAQADFDNDGDLDVLIVRGGWETPLRLSLLRNRGDAWFDDVTIASGLAVPIASMSACWGDYDNDGWVDLFVCGEYLSPKDAQSRAVGDPRNRCRLYKNRHDGTFVDVAKEAGVGNERCAQGAAWGDYDNDGRLDLFVSNRNGINRLYHNEGNGTFRDAAATTHLDVDDGGSACWFWDYDNDGWLDLFLTANRNSSARSVAASLDMREGPQSRPRLYRNLGPGGFRDVSDDVGLDRTIASWGGNFGDIDNDGHLDIYLANGSRSYSDLLPNRMLKNMEGVRFEDVTTPSETGGLHKGHGVSFADHDNDGDVDLFVNTGGTVPGDRSRNLLFLNPGHGRHWLKLKLKGTKTNRAAIGARIRVDLTAADGGTRSIHRAVGNNSSAGGNSLVASIGLGDANRVAALTITWSTSQTTQTFHDLVADQTLDITEEESSYKVLIDRKRRASSGVD